MSVSGAGRVLDAPRPDGRVRTTRVRRCRARIVRLGKLTHDTWELVVQRDDGEPVLLARAGQFATLTVDGISAPRAYSFARDPAAEAPGEHTFVIRAVPGGEMSEWIAGPDRTGTLLELAGPLGRFTLDDADGPMLFIAGGSGLSATYALIEAAHRLQLARDAHLFYGARARQDLYAGDAMQRFARDWHADHRFDYTEVLSEEAADSGWSGARGFVTDYLANTLLAAADFPAATVSAWLCGPPPMIDAGSALLLRAGVPAERIYRDVFEDASSPAPVIDNRRCVLCDECLLVRPVADCIVEAGGLGPSADGSLGDVQALVPGETTGLYYNSLVVDAARCIRCSACVNACPHGAISPGFSAVVDTLQHPRAAD